MRFHVVSLPHTQTTRAYSACAFTEKVRKFCNMMHDRGHEVHLYAGEKNEARCTQLHTCIDVDTAAAASKGKHYTEASWDTSLLHWQVFNAVAIAAIRANLQHKDFICVIGGAAHKAIGEAFPSEIVVEFGVGYHGTFANYRVFESYAHMHAVYAAQAGSSDIDGRWFDAVIPNYFEPEDFPPPDGVGSYFLFMGRLIDRKGYDIAIQTCNAIGAHLVLAGPGAPPAGADYRGVVGPVERAKLMRQARAVFVPTKYIEPFGGVAVEAMLCGTPVITTDWGAFPETVVDGVTGYRCRTLEEFIVAATNVGQMDRSKIRAHAMDRYTTDVVGDQYVAHFTRLTKLWGTGWYDRS